MMQGLSVSGWDRHPPTKPPRRVLHLLTSDARHEMACSPRMGSHSLFRDYEMVEDAAAAGMQVTPATLWYCSQVDNGVRTAAKVSARKGQ